MKNRTRSVALWVALAPCLWAMWSLAVPSAARAQTTGEPEAPGGHTETAAGEHETGEEGPAPINWTHWTAPEHRDADGHVVPEVPPPFIGPLFNFAVLVVVIYLAISRMVNPAMRDRSVAMQQEINEAVRMRETAEALLKEYEAKVAGLDREFDTLRAEAVRAGEAEKERILAEARAKAQRAASEAEFLVSQEVKQLRSELIREAVQAAVQSAEQAVKTQATGQDQQRLADEYVARLESGNLPGGGATA